MDMCLPFFLLFKDAMPALIDQNCLHRTFKPYLSSQIYSRKHENLPNTSIVIHAC